MNRILFSLFAALIAFPSADSIAQNSTKAAKKPKPEPFRWVSPLPTAKADALPGNVKHGTFKSESMGIDVGYYIYLPPGYDDPANADNRYPVVYHLHGGRPGGESKSASLVKFIHEATTAGKIQPTIYVWPNGGPMSWYNYPQVENGMGEDVFVKETIPHIDKTYRTDPSRGKRGLQGFSQGGRGTTRIMFKYPELFGSTAPGGSGYGPEKHIQEHNGEESEKIKFAPGYNAWDLAKAYADRKDAPKLRPMIWVGTKGFNYEDNLKFMDYLTSLGIPFEKIICPDATHSASMIYEKNGDELLQFHDRNFGK